MHSAPASLAYTRSDFERVVSCITSGSSLTARTFDDWLHDLLVRYGDAEPGSRPVRKSSTFTKAGPQQSRAMNALQARQLVPAAGGVAPPRICAAQHRNEPQSSSVRLASDRQPSTPIDHNPWQAVPVPRIISSFRVPEPAPGLARAGSETRSGHQSIRGLLCRFGHNGPETRIEFSGPLY